MPTTDEKLLEASRSLPEPLLNELLEFAEFLRAKCGVATSADPSLRLSSLCGGLESSDSFVADPLTIQRQIRMRRTRKLKLPDALIAATAIHHGLELLTLDEALLAVAKPLNT